MAGKRKPIDWVGIEADYRKTNTPVRELANRHRTDEGNIRYRAKRNGWTRPEQVVAKPVAKIEADVAKAEAVLTAAMKTPATSATDLVAEAYETLRDVMANSEFAAPRVSAAKVVLDFAKTESAVKGAGGKKDQANKVAAEIASGGRFAAPTPPKLVVDNR